MITALDLPNTTPACKNIPTAQTKLAVAQLIETMESTGESGVIFMEPAQTWNDEDEGTTSSPPTLVVALRGDLTCEQISHEINSLIAELDATDE